MRLFEAVILPSITYGISIYDTDLSHIRQIAGYFWKRWSGVSKFCRNNFLEQIYGFQDDFLHLKRRRGLIRRIVALFYSNGLHNMICNRPYTCYGHDNTLNCICRLCDTAIIDNNHLLNCQYNQVLSYDFITLLKHLHNGAI